MSHRPFALLIALCTLLVYAWPVDAQDTPVDPLPVEILEAAAQHELLASVPDTYPFGKWTKLTLPDGTMSATDVAFT